MDWLFQFNPKRWDPGPSLEGDTTRDEWSVNQGRSQISPDDRIFFWRVGQDAQLLAVGHVTSPVFECESDFGRYAVGVSFDYKIVPPLTKQEAIDNKILRSFRPFNGAMGTNFKIDDPAVVSELDNALSGRLVAISSTPTAQVISQQGVDAAIKSANRETSEGLRQYINQMDAYAFERLIGALLLKLGYTEVEVTKQSGDGGIDIKALLVAGGVARMQTCVQVKRQKSVGRPTVQNLRGSLGAHETGLLVISGIFTPGATEEAKAPTKAPIALIDGRRLIELLILNQIGVKNEKVELYRLRLDDLTAEGLQTLGENHA